MLQVCELEGEADAKTDAVTLPASERETGQGWGGKAYGSGDLCVHEFHGDC